MKHKVRYIILRLPAVFLLCSIMFACANIGNPNGGPYDEEPPKFVSSKPEANQLNFKGKKIEILFDEYIALESPAENVIVTPPQKQNPFIQAVGKKILVELKDTLKENTTYTVDFTSSIADNNAKNVLENFSFAFSTGDVLDTLQISGVLINAEDMEPVQRALVGIHSDLSDTAFTRTPFLRTSKTDERGRFIIHNISPGSYHLFALEDKNRNYAYDKNNDEPLAFLDSIIIPTCERGLVPDTVWRDTINYDTVRMVEKTLFYPNDLKLWFFTDSVTPRQRMLKPERSQDYIFTLKFNAPMDTFPVPIPLNFDPRDSMWYVTQRGEDRESFSINYWILDSMIYKADTLEVAVSYLKNNDTIPDLIELQTDTLILVNKDAVKKKKKTPPKKLPKIKPNAASSPADSLKTEEEKVPVIPLQLAVTPSGSLNPYDIISVKFNEPVMDVRKEFFVLEQGVDTLWEPVDFEFGEDPVLAMTYNITRPFNYEERYRLTIDSAAFCGVYGHCNNPMSVMMTVKGEKEYGHLAVVIQGLPAVENDTVNAPNDTLKAPATGGAVPAFMELLNSSGSPVAKAVVENGVATFKDMAPDKYYARLILDVNGNGVWDAGSYEEKRQPERVIY
ncbi:MAG: Ig-like domain-containing protein, partial [Tannerella sp.]|nr:Ig-like domain-containing protein [Tannerella sp.]